MSSSRSAGSNDDRPSASLANLRARARMLAVLRQFFDEHGYWEVETPLLSHDVCVDAFLDPFVVPDGCNRRLFLQTSPEFAMKRLLAAGADAIYQVTRSFRRGEAGRLHNPEFTIVEWYRRALPLSGQMDFVEQLVRTVHAASARYPESEPARECRPALSERPFVRMSYDSAFERFAGRRVLSAEPPDLAELARQHGIVVPHNAQQNDRDSWLNLLLAHVVEPGLAELGAVLIYDYPASQAALARIRHDDPPVAERFELYLDGIEICNGYQELTDADELLARMRRHAERRREAGLSELPCESRLADAMRRGFPDCSGVALGFDRLLMWCLGADSIEEVLAFPFERA